MSNLDLDFTGVGVIQPEDVYDVRVEDAETGNSKASNQPMVKMKMKIVGGDFDDFLLYDNFSLTPQALWKLQNFLEAVYGEKPEGAFKLDLEDILGRKLQVGVVNEDYNGQMQAKIRDYFPETPF